MARKDDPGDMPESVGMDTGQTAGSSAAPEIEAAATVGGEEAVARPLEDVATDRKVKPWGLAGLSRLAGWAPGKHVTGAEFDQALASFRARRMGGGR